MRLAWDGRRAWSENWNAPYPPRFMALLNYYFLNLPWLTSDPGVILGDPVRVGFARAEIVYLHLEKFVLHVKKHAVAGRIKRVSIAHSLIPQIDDRCF